MRNKFGSWSTGGKSADAGGTPIGKDKAKKLKKFSSNGMDKFVKPPKAANKKKANGKKPKAFGDDGAFKRTKKGI